MHFKYFYVLWVVVICSSCQKKYPGCKITLPVNGQVFNGGELVNIAVDMHDDGDALTGEALFIVKQNNSLDTVINHQQNDFLFGKYTLNESFVCEPYMNYKILALAWGGHGNKTVDSVLIKSN